MPQTVPSLSGLSLSTEGHRGASRVGMAVQSREELMNLAALVDVIAYQWGITYHVKSITDLSR